MPVEMGDLSHAYQEACHQVRSRIERFARGYWAQMPNYRDEAIKDMVAAITPRVLAGQEAVAELTDAYLAACADLMGLAAPTGEVMASEIAAGLRGVDPYLVYERPGKEVYRRLSEGKDIDAAAKAGGLRLLNLIGTDIQLARTRQGHRSMSSWGGDQFYRRTLTGRENCALCMIASTQHYRVDHVMPIHPGCDCGFEPLPPGVGIEQVIEPKRLEAAHKAVADAGFKVDRGGRFPDYSKIILQTRHGEVGPVIGFRKRGKRFNVGSKLGALTIDKQALETLDRGSELLKRMNSAESAGRRAAGVGFGIKKTGSRNKSVLAFAYRKRDKPVTAKKLRSEVTRWAKKLQEVGMLPQDFQVPAVKVYPGWEKPSVGVVRGKFEEKTNTLFFDPSYKEMGLTMIHELGHVLDWMAGPKDFASNVPGTIQNEIVKQLRHTETSKGYWHAELTTGKPINPETQSDDEVVYEMRRREVFARGYAQEAAYRMENAKLIKHVEAFYKEQNRQWPSSEFEPIRVLFEKLFPL